MKIRKLCIYLLLTVVFSVLVFLINLLFLDIKKKTIEDTYQSSEIVLEKINNWRSYSGYSKFINDDRLCRIAEQRAVEIESDWGHNGYDKYISAIRELGYMGSLGENLAKDFINPDLLLGQWLNSPSHRMNLEKDFTHTCVYCQKSYCVQLFAK